MSSSPDDVLITGIPAIRTALTPAEDAAENAENTLADAEAAYSGVSALVELLSGCQPGHQITGVFIRSLLEDVRAHLENVVGGLSPALAAELCQANR